MYNIIPIYNLNTIDSHCEIKELNNPSPLYTEPKAHAEEEETPEDEQRKSKLPKDIANDNPVLGQPRS